MADVKQTVTRTDDVGVNEQGATTRQATKQIHTESAADASTTAGNVVWYIYGVIAVLLGFRFVLKLFGANTGSGFVDFIYSVSGVLTSPFDNIFGVATARTGDVRSVFEPSILVAIAVYGLIAWGIVRLIRLNHND